MASGPTGVHFVGSIPLPTTEATLRTLSSALPNHITRLPDGEPAHRGNFVFFQREVIPPRLMNTFFTNLPETDNPDLTLEEVTVLEVLDTGYDSAAIESYETFKRLKAEGVILPHVKFQVCLPTPANVIAAVDPKFQAAVEPYYHGALQRALSNIQANIPHQELAIQIDMAIDFALIESAVRNIPVGPGGAWKYWFEPVEEGIVQRVIEMVKGKVAEDVELGVHFCYGDAGHKHFVEPEDTQHIATVMRGVLEGVGRKVDWVHFPVPKERCMTGEDADVYLGPLAKHCLKLLKEGETEVYLGCVKEEDEQGTRKRVKCIGKWLGEREEGMGLRWGVATECGGGRTPPEHLDGILRLLREVSAAVRGKMANGNL